MCKCSKATGERLAPGPWEPYDPTLSIALRDFLRVCNRDYPLFHHWLEFKEEVVRWSDCFWQPRSQA